MKPRVKVTLKLDRKEGFHKVFHRKIKDKDETTSDTKLLLFNFFPDISIDR